jgi:hypothetical protein
MARIRHLAIVSEKSRETCRILYQGIRDEKD